jgi:hypothetical protein
MREAGAPSLCFHDIYLLAARAARTQALWHVVSGRQRRLGGKHSVFNGLSVRMNAWFGTWPLNCYIHRAANLKGL